MSKIENDDERQKERQSTSWLNAFHDRMLLSVMYRGSIKVSSVTSHKYPIKLNKHKKYHLVGNVLEPKQTPETSSIPIKKNILLLEINTCVGILQYPKTRFQL